MHLAAMGDNYSRNTNKIQNYKIKYKIGIHLKKSKLYNNKNQCL